MSNNAHELSNRLLNALDNNYNVVDMHAVNEIISILEKINITKELLETTRLGKHVNELRRKTSDPTLARRAKVLVKRWRDLVIPAAASPLHTGSNRSSAERQARRLGNTPITSPAFARQVVSPAVPSPRPPSRPAWGGYESDSNDVILVDDEPAPAPAPALAQLTPPKRPPSPEAPQDEKKTKRDKKPKKRRGHRAEAAAGAGAWAGRNGDARGNGVRLDPYAALVHRLPPAGAKKVKTTKELLAQIQSQSRGAPRSPASPASPASPDVMLVEPDEPSPVKAESPLRNGGSPAPPPPPPRPAPSPPAPACGCGDRADPACAAAPRAAAPPAAVRALHHALLPGVNGTRAPPLPARYAVRPLVDPARPELFASVVPLYRYSDHADDRCVKNMSRIPLCEHLPWTEFAPAPPSPPPRAAPPPPRPYPQDSPEPEDRPPSESVQPEEIEPAAPTPAELADRLKPPLIAPVDENVFRVKKCESVKTDVADEFASEQQEHRTVERTKPTLDGAALYALCQQARRAVPYGYELVDTAPVLALPTDAAAPELGAALAAAAAGTARDALGRPEREPNFAEWHESAVLGDLVALPYVVLD